MDCHAALFFCVATFFALSVSEVEGRNKKVVIHVPYKVKKIKHTHTVYKTIHHHHHPHGGMEGMYSEPVHHLAAPSEDHEHFHHMMLHEDPTLGQHSQPIPGIGIPDFLPDVPLDVPDIPEVEVGRHHIPLFRRALALAKEKSDAESKIDVEMGRQFLRRAFELAKDTTDDESETGTKLAWIPTGAVKVAREKKDDESQKLSPTNQSRIEDTTNVTS